MRGPPIAMAAACAEILGSVLERCGVQSEILASRPVAGAAAKHARNGSRTVDLPIPAASPICCTLCTSRPHAGGGAIVRRSR
jgi:hypothetical protein